MMVESYLEMASQIQTIQIHRKTQQIETLHSKMSKNQGKLSTTLEHRRDQPHERFSIVITPSFQKSLNMVIRQQPPLAVYLNSRLC